MVERNTPSHPLGVGCVERLPGSSDLQAEALTRDCKPDKPDAHGPCLASVLFFFFKFKTANFINFS